MLLIPLLFSHKKMFDPPSMASYVVPWRVNIHTYIHTAREGEREKKILQLIFTSIPLGNKKGILPKCSHVKVKLSSLPIHKRNKDLVHQRNMEKLVGKQTFLEYIAEINS